MLSAILGPDGKLVTAWAVPWTEPLPDQEKLVGLIRSLNAIRRRYPEFLLHGRMIRPPFSVETKLVGVAGDPYGHKYGEALWSYWQDADGNTKGFATNWQKHPVTIHLVWPNGKRDSHEIAPLETIELGDVELLR